MTSVPTKQKQSVVVVYTGEGKGKTSAGLGLLCRALGHGDSVAFIQFIKAWHVSEHAFIESIQPLYGEKLYFHKGGKGFYNAGAISAKNVSNDEHQVSALQTYQLALDLASSGNYKLVICDEVNNAVHDGLLAVDQLKELISTRHRKTSLCLTGRNFPSELTKDVDILSNITEVKHHYNDGFIANAGIDY